MKRSIINRMEARRAQQLEEEEKKSEAEGNTSKTGYQSSEIIANSAPVASMGKALSQIAGERIISLDPKKIERSPFADRLDNDDEFEAAIEELKVSIKAEGQKIPVLVRPHPEKQGYYQLAYGFRRLEAIKRIITEDDQAKDLKIRGYIRPLDDLSLAKEQSLENGVRENLSWIEQALWARQLLELGFAQKDICPVVGKGKSTVSALIKVANEIPHDIIQAIGRARGSGRPTWSKFAVALSNAGALERVRAVLNSDDFLHAPSHKRLDIALSEASGKPERVKLKPKEIEVNGQVVAIAKQSSSGITFAVSHQDFAAWLLKELPSLAQKFEDQNT